jgi:hypothetical protein
MQIRLLLLNRVGQATIIRVHIENEKKNLAPIPLPIYLTHPPKPRRTAPSIKTNRQVGILFHISSPRPDRRSQFHLILKCIEMHKSAGGLADRAVLIVQLV